MSNRPPSRLFIQVDRPELENIELRTNWINPAAIAQVIKKQRGNSLHVHIYWLNRQTHTELEGAAAKAFLKVFE